MRFRCQINFCYGHVVRRRPDDDIPVKCWRKWVRCTLDSFFLFASRCPYPRPGSNDLIRCNCPLCSRKFRPHTFLKMSRKYLSKQFRALSLKAERKFGPFFRSLRCFGPEQKMRKDEAERAERKCCSFQVWQIKESPFFFDCGKSDFAKVLSRQF